MTVSRFLFALFLSILAPATVRAQSQADFSGKVLTLVIGFEAGGAYDAYGRLFARYFGDRLPGRPKVVTENRPGAGGLIAANYIYNVAPKDGTVIGMISQTAAIGQILQTPGVQYDVRGFGWIGRLTANVQVLNTWGASATKTFADAKAHQVIIAGTGPTSSSVVFPRMMDAELGAKFKVVPGFTGVASATLAMERGEVDGVVRPWADVKAKNPDWIAHHTINPIVVFSIRPDPDIANVPAIVDLAKTPEQRQLFALFASGDDVGDSILTPPGLPSGALKALRAGYEETIRDPRFIADAKRALLEIDPLDGDSLAALNTELFKTPPAIVKLAKSYSGVP